jgi:hypothetical protein
VGDSCQSLTGLIDTPATTGIGVYKAYVNSIVADVVRPRMDECVYKGDDDKVEVQSSTASIRLADEELEVQFDVVSPRMDECIYEDGGVINDELQVQSSTDSIRSADEEFAVQSRKPPWEEYWDEFERKRRVRFALVAVNWMAQKTAEVEMDLRCCAAVTADDPAQPTLSDSGSNIDIITKDTAKFAS